MKCHNCGNQIPNNALFCDICGQKVENIKKEQDLYCSNCGAKLENGMDFCGECGTPINTTHRSKIIENKPKKKNKGILIITLLITIIVILVIVIMVYIVHPTDNESVDNDTKEPQMLITSTPISPITLSPAVESSDNTAKNETISEKYVVSDRTDLYNPALTYKRMPEIHNTVLVDDYTFLELKNVINEFDVQCTDYMNEVTNEVPPYLKAGTTAYNQQVEYRQKHPTLNQVYQTVDVINARQSESYYYVWVTEVLNVTESGASRTDTDHWVYKIENNNGQWYICDYTADPAF